MIKMSASLKELDICKFQALQNWNAPLKQTWNDSRVMNEQTHHVMKENNLGDRESP